MGSHWRPRLAVAPSNAMAVPTSLVPWHARGSSAGRRGIEAVRGLVQTVYLTRQVVQASLFCACDGQGPATAASVLGLRGDPATWIASPR
jgi:hypothetical protein